MIVDALALGSGKDAKGGDHANGACVLVMGVVAARVEKEGEFGVGNVGAHVLRLMFSLLFFKTGVFSVKGATFPNFSFLEIVSKTAPFSSFCFV